MKTLSYRLGITLLYIAVAGVSLYMYSLRWEGHVSPWDIISRSGDTKDSPESHISTERTRKFLRNNNKARALLREHTDTFSSVISDQIELTNTHCSKELGELDSLLTSSDPDRFAKFIDQMLGLASPTGTEERLNPEVIRYSFFPDSVETLPDSQQQNQCLTVDLIKPEHGSAEDIVSIQGVLPFLIHSSACEEETTSSK